MNHIKRELIDAAGDFSVAKERVLTQVAQQLQQPQKRAFPFKRLALTVVLLAVFLLTFPRLFQPKTASDYSPDELVLFYTLLHANLEVDEDMANELAVNAYFTDRALLAFAEAQHITISQQTQQQWANDLQNIIATQYGESFKKQTEQALLAAGYSWTDFERFIESYFSKVPAIHEALEVHYRPHYTAFEPSFVSSIIQNDALHYFQTHYAAEITALEQQWQQPFPVQTGNPYYGVILQQTDNAVYIALGFIDAASEQHYETSRESFEPLAYWIPKGTDWAPLSIGDRIGISLHTFSTTVDPNVTYPYAAIGSDITTSEETLHFKLPENEQTQQLLNSIGWQQQDKDMKNVLEKPHLQIQIGSVFYNVWQQDEEIIHIKDLKNQTYTQIPLTELTSMLESYQ